MNREDYVSLEVAKMLKEKGFKEPCKASRLKNGELKLYDLKQSLDNMTSIGEEYYEFLCPTLYETQKWLREKHNTYAEVDSSYNKNGKLFAFTINHYDKNDNWDWEWVNDTNEYYKEYEAALNAGILKALKLIL